MFRLRTLVLLVVATFALAACGSSGADQSDSSGGELRDFAEVQDGDIVFEADPTDPNRGIFRVTTTEPMICAIIWGETEDFGNFNNSLAMSGTGIVQHDVVLPGAAAGQTYYYRVQGSTSDGLQYRSELATFTIPEIEGSDESADVERGPDLTADATLVEVSSVFGPGFEAEQALDGDTNTEWASAGDGDEGFITIDLGSEQEVGGVEFLTRRMLDGTATTQQYTITVDGGESFGPFSAGSPVDPNFTEVSFTGQEVRFDVDTSTGGNVGAIEVRVYGPSS